MKIERITLREIRMPLVHFFETSFGRTTERRILLVTVEGAPALLGKTIERGRDVPALMARVRGHRMAKAAMENAVWDAEARASQQPLWKLLGGTRREIACGVSIGIQDSPGGGWEDTRPASF